MSNPKDLRYRILEYLEKEGNSTEEVRSNLFLSSLHPDLGSIKRTLVELIELGYINESNVNWERDRENASVIFAINTRGSEDQKSSARLLNEEDINPIRLYLTLTGKRFLIEDANLRRQTFNLKFEWLIRFAFMIIGFLFTILGMWVNTMMTDPKSDQKNKKDVIERTMKNVDSKRIESSKQDSSSMIKSMK